MVYKNFLNDKQIQAILDKPVDWYPASTVSADANYRIVDTADVRHYGNLKSMVGRQIYEHNSNFRYDVKQINEMNMLHYRKGSHYDWHQDVSWAGKMHRKFTFILQLSHSDAYKGGDLEFRDAVLDTDGIRERGSLIIFPSLLYHRITPLKSGDRYSIVGWAVGPRWK